ncbi:hypothetical protein WICPIJ_006691, partial [Wickerhamomyces pijperi]
GKKLGILSKDKYAGKFIDEWNAVWDASKSEFDLVDCATGVSATLEHKDEDEQRSLRTAARASTNMMSYFTDKMSKIIDEELTVSNAKLV